MQILSAISTRFVLAAQGRFRLLIADCSDQDKCQGTSSLVPSEPIKHRGFSPCAVLESISENDYDFEGSESLLPEFFMSQKAKFKFSAGAVGAVAIGAFAVGAVAVGALAIGRLAIGRLAVGRGKLGSLEIGELTVRRLKVKELQVENTLQLPGGQGRELQEPA